METQIRQATADDVDRMVELSDQKRMEYQGYSPVFWRKAADSAEKQKPFLTSQLERENNICLVAEQDGRVVGFIVAGIVSAPPVYDPGGLVVMIDDYTVESPDLWPTVGKALTDEVSRIAKERGAVLTVTVCGERDEPKREMLRSAGAEIASEWWVREL